MPIDLAPMPLRVRAVALPGGDAAADDLRRSLSDPVVEGLRIDHQRVGGPWDSEADRGLTEGLVDLVLLVTEPHDEGGHAAFLADAVAVLSADATIGAVGRPHTATAPARPLAPAAGELLVRADALRLVGGLGDAPPGPGYDVDLCARLWAAGFRVATAGVPSDAAQPAWNPELQRRLTEAIALLLDDEDLEGSAWRAAEAAAALAAVTARRAALAPLRQRGSGRARPDAARVGGAVVRPLAARRRRWSSSSGSAPPIEPAPRRRVLVVTMDVLAPVHGRPGHPGHGDRHRAGPRARRPPGDDVPLRAGAPRPRRAGRRATRRSKGSSVGLMS